MQVILDVEANGLENATKVWLVVLKDILTGRHHIFRNLTDDETEKERFNAFASKVSLYIGHNLIEYDLPVLARLVGFVIPPIERIHDTLILSRLIDYSRDGGHSIEDYGLEFGTPKGDFHDFSKYSQEMEDYCVRDVDICHKIYVKYAKYINNMEYRPAILLEHRFQLCVNSLHNNGFSFNVTKATSLLSKIEKELEVLDKEILKAFLPRPQLVKEIQPRLTQHGTLNKIDFKWYLAANPDGDLSQFNGSPFSRISWRIFNPSSPKQIVEVLNEAGWKPTERTKTYVETEREYNQLKRKKNKDTTLDLRIEALYNKLKNGERTSWKVNEKNLETLPKTAPAPAKTLAKRILLESRRRTLVEWISLVCFEIKISKESIKKLGNEIKERLILSGVPRSKSVTEKDIEKEILKSLENLFYKSSDIINKKKGNEDTTFEIPTDLLSKILIKWLKTKRIDAEFAKENEDFLWITNMPQEKFEGSYALDVTHVLDGLKPNGLQYSIISERVRGRFLGLGAWTHRMAHQKPNMANAPNSIDNNGNIKLYGGDLRSLFQAPKNRLLVGVDAEGIQLRIFAHYIDDKELIESLVKGSKHDKTDPHSLNRAVLGKVCKHRQAAKRFLYALFLGAGHGKLSEILECSREESDEALARLIRRYPGFEYLKKSVIPADAKRGWFHGLDGRAVRIPGDTTGTRQHLCMSGYLQNGEAVVMKSATIKWEPQLKEYDSLLVNLVHDEWQTETPNNMEIALKVAKIQADSLREVGEDLKLKCPLAGSYWNEDIPDYTVGTNWKVTH